MFKCMKAKCNKRTREVKFIKKNTNVKYSTEIGVCVECYDKRQKWLKSRGLL